ncbi:MAG: hypothetical protein KDD45_06225, partial [Bdellovibrionales bacterium]|nr:hypothetical protein [Bdellovibrionales bacterium]
YKETNLLQQGPGTSFSFSIKKQHFIFLDARSFRSPDSDPHGNYFSETQAEWINSQFKKNPHDFFWLISGSQWFGTKGQDESFEINHPFTIDSFFQKIELTKYNVQLISGDSHFSEIKKILIDSKNIFEITSSAMHALPVGKLEPDNRRLSASNLPNFVLGEINLETNEDNLFTAYTLFNRTLFKHKVP